MGRSPLLPLVIFVVCGLFDGVLGLVARAPQGVIAGEWFALLPVLALWLVFGGLLWAGYALLWWLCFARDRRQALRARLAETTPSLWRERRSYESRRVSANVLAALSSLALFVSASVYAAANLIENRHGSMLIASAIVGAQLVIAGGCVLWALIVRRVLLGAFQLVVQRLRMPTLVSAPMVLGVILTVVAVVIAIAVRRHAETLVAIDASAIALSAGALLGLVVAHAVAAPARPLPLFLVALGVLALLWFGLQSPVARSFASNQTLVAKYVLAELRDASDFDKDGTPWFPGGEDCAPFDARRHPFALEKSRNGIDENCDGVDDFARELVAPSRHTKPMRTIAPQPNLVLITIDATRADHMGFMGYKRRPTTPHLDALANKSSIFTAAFSQDSGTGPSLWSLMTGRTPFQVKLSSAKRFPFVISPDETLLAEALRRGGYQTSAILCGSVFAKPHWNIRRGFTQYAEVCGKEVNKVSALTATEAIHSLQKLRADRPFFFWVHLLAPHHPYRDHAELNFGSKPIDRYDEEIHAADAAIGRILKAVGDLPSARPTYIAITADHGENFNEHGSAQHARTLYREVTHVPLVIAGPEVKARKVTAPVASSDLYPTFLELAGLTIPERSTMESQFNVLFGAPADKSRLVFQENSFSRPRRHVKAVVSDRRHLLFDTSNHVLEMYDWRNDPQERVNLYGNGEAEEHRLRQALLLFLTTTTLPPELKK